MTFELTVVKDRETQIIDIKGQPGAKMEIYKELNMATYYKMETAEGSGFARGIILAKLAIKDWSLSKDGKIKLEINEENILEYLNDKDIMNIGSLATGKTPEELEKIGEQVLEGNNKKKDSAE